MFPLLYTGTKFGIFVFGVGIIALIHSPRISLTVASLIYYKLTPLLGLRVEEILHDLIYARPQNDTTIKWGMQPRPQNVTSMKYKMVDGGMHFWQQG